MATEATTKPLDSGAGPDGSGWTVFLCSLAVFLMALEITIISVALPRIEETFVGSTRSTLSWIFTAYNVGVASLLLIGGWIAERFGRKLVFQIGLAVFAAGSVVSGIAPSIEILIGGRVIQSVGGALLLPSSLALVLHSVAADKRDAAIGVWGAMAGLAAAVGPTAGALLVQYAGWRWIFLINVPIVLIAMASGARVLVETRDPAAPKRVDIMSVPLGAIGTGLLVLSIVAAGPLGFTNPTTVAAFAGAAVLLTIFARRSVRHPSPLFPPNLLRNRSFRIGVIGTGIFGAGFAGWLVLAPTFFVDVWDYSVLRAGFAIAPAPIAMAVVARPAGRLVERVGYRMLIGVGAVLPALAVLWWTVTIDVQPAYVTAFLPGAILFGIGVGVCFPMLTAASMVDVAPHQESIGAAGNTTLRQVSMALGISVAIAIVGLSEGESGANSALGLTEQANLLEAFQWSWGVAGVLFVATSYLIALSYPQTVRSASAAPQLAPRPAAAPTTTRQTEGKAVAG